MVKINIKMANFHIFAIVVLMVGICIRSSDSHGRLVEPPSRASLWRDPEFQGRNVVPNYNDNGLNCGGRSYQHESMGGRCGICGDPWDSPRDHEAGGRYAKGIITRHYKVGDVIDARIHVTASHKGYFEFRICPNNDVNKRATHGCLDQNLLRQENGHTKFFYGSRSGVYDVRLRLPPHLSCRQCVFQWKWHTGNSWGRCPSGYGRLGCGPQEEFYACADISIGDPDSEQPSTTPGGNVQPSTTKPTIPTSMSTTATTSRTTTKPAAVTAKVTTTTEGTKPNTTTPRAAVTAKPGSGSTTCRATPAWSLLHGMSQWCANNCAQGYCPGAMCTCSDKPKPGAKCRPTRAQARVRGMVFWCNVNCAAGNCPPSHCTCS